MGQKVHPRSIRLGITQGWDSTWIASPKEYRLYVKEDQVIRKALKDKLKSASVSRIEIDRKAQKLIVRIITARPGVVVGRGGQGLDTLRKMLFEKTGRKDIRLDVLEVARPEIEAQLVAESIAQQLERRAMFRRVLKQTIQRSMRSGAKGIKIMVSGRLGGVEIARKEWSKEGCIPLHTFRADIDYGFAEALTTYGIIGCKVWVYRGEVLPGGNNRRTENIKAKGAPSGDDQGPRRGGPGGDRRPGGPGGDRDRRPGGGQRRGGPGGDRRPGGGQGPRPQAQAAAKPGPAPAAPKPAAEEG